MKKIVVMGVLLGLLLVFSGPAEAASGGRFFFGAFAEMGQCLSYQVIGFGGEIGYAISDLISVVAEGAAGHMSLESRSESSYSSYHDTMDMNVTPFCFSIHVTAPLGDRVQPYVGIGLAYNNLKLTYTDTSEYEYYGGLKNQRVRIATNLKLWLRCSSSAWRLRWPTTSASSASISRYSPRITSWKTVRTVRRNRMSFSAPRISGSESGSFSDGSAIPDEEEIRHENHEERSCAQISSCSDAWLSLFAFSPLNCLLRKNEGRISLSPFSVNPL